jgi:selenocysteine-specific elongation factor
VAASDVQGPARPLILGTAGHIDHGKTLLIKLLTGIDTDRLAEEKKRGISIELGFASMATPAGHRLGVVDVPGHERFIKTMLAGAGGIDLILFVIAADEGVMPQTREHMEILELLGIERGIIVLTKIDMVDEDWLELVQEDVRSYIASTPLSGAPISLISSVTGRGKEELLAAIDALIPGLEVEDRGRIPRLPVDRVFTMEGFGTVVTGTLWAGRFHAGDAVRILPQGIETRIKALEVHGERVETSFAGQRTAVSIHAVDREKVARGDWLTTRPDVEPVRMVNGKVHCLKSAAKPLKNGARIRFYLGAAEILGRVIFLEKDEVEPGGDAWAQIRLDEPTMAERGDRFVLRTYSPARTVAGGSVILSENRRRRRYREEDLKALQMSEKGTPQERVLDRLAAHRALGRTYDELSRDVGQPRDEIRAVVEELVRRGDVALVGRDRFVLREGIDDAGDRVVEILRGFQEDHPLRWGMTKSEVKSRLSSGVHPDVVEVWVQRELEAGRLFPRKDRLRWGADEIRLTPTLQKLRDEMLRELEDRGFAGPNQKELVDAFASRPGKEGKLAAEMVALLLEEGVAARIPPQILLHGKFLAEIPALLRKHFDSGKTELGVPQFKDILGVTRKQAVPLLEYLDREQLTIRDGDVRRRGPRLDGD